MNGKLLNEGYKPIPRPEPVQRGYQGGSNCPTPPRPAPPTPPRTVSSIVKPKE